MTVGEFERAKRLDAALVVERLRAEAGADISFVAPCPGGQVGAAYVTYAGGPGVLTWSPRTSLERQQRRTALLDLLRGRAVPVPEYLGTFQLDGDVVVIQQRLPGGKIDVLTDDLAAQMIQASYATRGVFATVTGDPSFPLYLTEPGPGFCLHEPLRQHSVQTRRLLAWVEEVGRQHPPVLGGDDIVHGDFHPGQCPG